MSKDMEQQGNVGLYKLMRSDINHVAKKAGISSNQLSTFADQTGNDELANPTTYFQTLADDRKFTSIATKLLTPDLRIDFHRGGAFSVEEFYYVLFSLADDEVLVQFQSEEEEVLMMLFTSNEDFLTWWTQINATESTGEYESVFPDVMETEVLVCALHCIDLYRRSYIESVLNYSGELQMQISKSDYTELLKIALSSGDKRWYLPTMVETTPGIAGLQLSLKPVHLEKLEELKFLSIEDDGLRLDERSVLMGTEMITGWLGSVGCQASVLVNGIPMSMSSMFLTATPYTNHLVSFSTTQESNSSFRYQTLAMKELIQILEQWISSLKNLVIDSANK